MLVLTLINENESLSYEFLENITLERTAILSIDNQTLEKELTEVIFLDKNYKQELYESIKGIMDEGFKLKQIDDEFNKWLSSDEIGSGAYFITDETIKKMCIELCSHCGTEVEIPCDKASLCPECGNRILPCSMCDCDVVDCNNCKFEIEKNY